MTSAISKVQVSIIAGSLAKTGMSVNSWGVYVYSDANMTNQVDYVTGGTISKTANVFEFTPMQIKLSVTGDGKADKKSVQFMTKTILRLKQTPKPDDAADALAVALCLAQMSSRKMAFRSQRIQEASSYLA